MCAHRSLALALAALASFGSDDRATAVPQAQQDRLVSKLEQLIERTIEEHSLPGLSVSMDLGGETLLARGWGTAAPERLIAASPASPYRAGSLTTQFVAVALLGLVDQERLDLRARVAAYLPALADDERPVTLEHVLSNASGYPPLADFVAGRGDSPEELTPEHVLAWLARSPLLATPGECFVYSDTNTYLLGLILEQVSGQSVPAYLQSHIFDPLRMEETLYSPEPEDLHAFAVAGQEIAGRFESNGMAPGFFAAQALCTSARDLVRFQRALLGRELISDQSYRRMTSPHRLPDGSSTYYGLALNLTPLEDYASLSYGGGMSGSRVHLAWYPAFDLTIAVLADGDDVQVAQLERRLARRVFGLPEPGVQDLPLSDEERAVYLGDYYIACDRLSVRADEDGRLVVQAPAEAAQVLLNQGFHVFVAQHDPEVRYLFQVEDELATGFVLEEQGSRTNAVRMR